MGKEEKIFQLASESDESLMVFYQNGEYEAFTALYERHSGKVYAYLKGHVFERSAVDDLLQQIFLKLHEHRSRYNPSFPFLPWLFSITRNTVIDFSRKKKATPIEDEKLEQIAGIAKASDEEPALDLQAALASLPQESRELIQMRFEEGMSFDDISERLRLNAPTVRKRVSRAMKTIKKFLGRENE